MMTPTPADRASANTAPAEGSSRFHVACTLLKTGFSGRGKVEVSRFKGLGEMPARYLKATTMDPAQRTLLRVTLPPKADPAAIELPADELARTKALVETLMGRRPELRFEYIQKNARFARDLDV